MATFPPNPKDGQLYEADNGVYYVYRADKNVWQSNNVTPIWSDQVFIRGVENQTQQGVNDITKAASNKVYAIATSTGQLLEVAFDVKTRGIWKHQSGPSSPDEPPVGLQCFLVEDAEGNRTQEYSKAAVLVIHAIGGGPRDTISIGATEIGDLITIQNQNDLQGGSYIVTGIEEFDSDDPNELTDAYARYTVTVNEKATNGMFSADEMVTIRIFPRPTEGMGVDDYDGRYLQLKAPNDVNNQFRIKGTGGTYISTAGDELGIYHLKTPTDVTHGANKGYVDEQIAAIEIPDGELSTREKLYLQGFYPFKIAQNTQVESEGEMTVKKDNYLVDLDPETWKYFSFSVVDAYGLDLAAKSLNHMHMDNYYFAQIWFLREDGRKLCSYIAEMKAKDNNFEQKFDLEMKNGKEFISSKSWDLPSLRVDKGEVLWVKCSFWGN
mgnify:FL=1